MSINVLRNAQPPKFHRVGISCIPQEEVRRASEIRDPKGALHAEGDLRDETLFAKDFIQYGTYSVNVLVPDLHEH